MGPCRGFHWAQKEKEKEKILFIALVLLITNTYGGKFENFHRNIKKKMDCLEYWHPEATVVNSEERI